MRTTSLKCLLIGLAMLTSGSLSAQFDVVDDFMQAGAADASTVLEAYLEPIGRAWGYDLASGWYKTAGTHSLLGFSLNFTLNMAFPPEAAKTFDMAALDLEKIRPLPQGSPLFPTIVSNESNSFRVVETIAGTEHTLVESVPLRGFPIAMVPLPNLTASIGLIRNTDLALRFVPNVRMGDYGQIGLWGVGVKHDILQWLPFVRRVPFVRLSAFAGYSRLSYSYEIDYTVPANAPAGFVDRDDHQLSATLGAFHGALLVGVEVPFVAPYVSVGLTSSRMNMDLLGNYAVPSTVAALRTELENPVSMEFTNRLAPSVTAGLRFKFAVITLHGQYTFQEYGTFTAGLGISFR